MPPKGSKRSPSPAATRSGAARSKSRDPKKAATPARATPSKKAATLKKATATPLAEPKKEEVVNADGTRLAMSGDAVKKDESSSSKIKVRVFWGIVMVLGKNVVIHKEDGVMYL